MEKMKFRVRTHAGTRYAGAAQKTTEPEEPYQAEPGAKRRRSRPPRAYGPRKSMADKRRRPPTEPSKIEWTLLPIPLSFSLDYETARTRLKQILYQRRAVHSELYESLIEQIDALICERGVAPSRLSVLAAGTLPGKSKGSDFIKIALHLSAEETREAILPTAFRQHCKKALIPETP